MNTRRYLYMDTKITATAVVNGEEWSDLRKGK
jgi:hypothetical protein